MKLFTSFEGRISRKSFWFGLLVIIALSIVVSWALLPLALSGGIGIQLLLFALSFALLYPMVAVAVKRLHDRNKAAVPWAIIFFAPGVLANFLSTFKIGYSTIELVGQQIPVPGTAAYIVLLLAMVAGLWMLIELGFLRGTKGTNQYGEDPLAANMSPQTV